RSRRRRLAQIAQELHGEVFRKQREMAAILLGAAHEEFHLSRKFIERPDRAKQILKCRDSYARPLDSIRIHGGGFVSLLKADAYGVFRVEPFEQRRITARVNVLKIFGNDVKHDQTIGKLEAERRVFPLS